MGKYVARSRYIARQVATLLKFAKATANPNVAAAMVEKAADLKAEVDDKADRSLKAPDVESSPN